MVRERLAVRHALDAQGLGWHLARAGELDGILEAADVHDFVIDGSAGTPEDQARKLLAGWA
ncbi:hypothetical protein OIE66_13035 [Nonomuraea sp. NBC_01738]|uniref:hypothetical protein n=1 Tax=Nonomuraea sp. NBC_01738 TaxID=2976003 RepID=UPI002E11FD62|nr:hypothetical protein OIE66_13035 [Nonomuraea sp. NBC_01738]